jgi:transcriptional regulator with XRE-family HTH domain
MVELAAAVPAAKGEQAPVADARSDPARRAFAENLRTACAKHKSISKVCRDLGINRQQFNKYLSGASFPSAYNLGRICRYLGIDAATMALADADAAAEISEPAPVLPLSLPFGPILRQMHDANPEAQRKLERYIGYYHSYYNSPAYPGHILKSVSRIYRRQDMFFEKTLERLVRPDDSFARMVVHRYNGAVIHTADRLYVLHHTLVHHQTLSLVAFYPSFSAVPRMLSGVFVSVSSGPGRQPFASRCVYEYHGRTPDLRRMVAASGLYETGSPAIGEEISRRLDNHIIDDAVLRAMEY